MFVWRFVPGAPAARAGGTIGQGGFRVSPHKCTLTQRESFLLNPELNQERKQMKSKEK